MRYIFKRFAGPVLVYLLQLLGERQLSAPGKEWIWALVTYAAIAWAVVAFLSVDWIWDRLFAKWVPTLRLVWPSQREAVSPEWDNRLTTIKNRKYLNETVEVDGKLFDGCSFENVTFLFKGRGPTRFHECHFNIGNGRAFLLQTDHPAAGTYAKLWVQFQSFPGGNFVMAERTHQGTFAPIDKPVFSNLSGAVRLLPEDPEPNSTPPRPVKANKNKK